MAKIKRKLHIQFGSIRNRMIFSFLLVFLVVLIFMGSSIYLFTVNMLRQGISSLMRRYWDRQKIF